MWFKKYMRQLKRKCTMSNIGDSIESGTVFIFTLYLIFSFLSLSYLFIKPFNMTAISPLQASMDNTPIHRWYLPDVPDEFEVYIKREDLTGCTLSGNKVSATDYHMI